MIDIVSSATKYPSTGYLSVKAVHGSREDILTRDPSQPAKRNGELDVVANFLRQVHLRRNAAYWLNLREEG